MTALRAIIRSLLLAALVLALAGCRAAHPVTLKWKASASAVTGYRVYRTEASSDSPKMLSVTRADTTQYIDKTAEPGHTYVYFVTSIDSSRKESVASDKITVTIPAR